MDNTAAIVCQWQVKDCGFETRYIYKENGGMHTVHNTVYENIDAERNTMLAVEKTILALQGAECVNAYREIGNTGFDV